MAMCNSNCCKGKKKQNIEAQISELVSDQYDGTGEVSSDDVKSIMAFLCMLTLRSALEFSADRDTCAATGKWSNVIGYTCGLCGMMKEALNRKKPMAEPVWHWQNSCNDI
jgi:hypothetical protein